jgi:hypothetical protein
LLQTVYTHTSAANSIAHAFVTELLSLGWHSKCVLSEMSPLLLQVWRKQHPDGHEQVLIDFTVGELPAKPVALFPEENSF